MEYMSREDYCEIACGKENREGYKTCHNCSMLNVPAADVHRVKRGKWELIDKQEDKWIPTYTCSECSQSIVTYKCNYCPNCGTDMRGEDNAESKR